MKYFVNNYVYQGDKVDCHILGKHSSFREAWSSLKMKNLLNSLNQGVRLLNFITKIYHNGQVKPLLYFTYNQSFFRFTSMFTISFV